MNNSISFLVTCHDEDRQLNDLLSVLVDSNAADEIVILSDKPSDAVKAVISSFVNRHYSRAGGFPFIKTYSRNLKGDYASHKNFGTSLCSRSHVFQLDADEMPSSDLLASLPELLELNPDTELFYIPRINAYTGVTQEIAAGWGWNIDNEHKWVNWHTGDYQGRLYKNTPALQWHGKLHERIQGANRHAVLPKEEQWAILHNKTIEKQLETNKRYNRDFSEAENRGHKLNL